MWEPFLGRGTLIVLFGTLALGNLTACTNTEAANVPNKTASSAPNSSATSAAQPSVEPPPSVEQPQPSEASDTYQQAIDIATGAVNVSKSAVSREDWSLAASHWQAAIKLLKVVPPASRQYKTAQKKLTEYQSYLADAKLRATPPQSKPCSGETNPDFFSIPINGRIGGTPIVEVTFNDRKFDMLFDTGASKSLITLSMAASLRLIPTQIISVRIANGSVVILPVAQVKSQEIDGRFKIDVPVAVAPAEAEFGLLGQDFYKGYDVSIKENVIEFHRRASNASVKQQKATCLVDTNPQFFSVPIRERKQNIPIVEVTFNNQYKFPLLFDTGASGTVITRSMAVKMRLKPVGTTAMAVADGSVVPFGVTHIKSQKIGTRIKRDVLVSVAPPAMDVGLLGQDFFEGYNYTIKGDVIEFRRQEP